MPTLYVNQFLTWVATHTYVNDAGTWRLVATYENNGGTWRLIQSPLLVSCPSLSRLLSGASACGSVQSNAANPTVTGGVSPFTYAWAHVSTSSGNTPSCSNAAIATPTFQATVCDGTPSVSSWTLTVTDSAGAQASVTISVTLDWVNSS